MRRRSAGLVVMLVALFAVVVVISAQVHGRRVVVGAARAAPVPGPPAVGDCLLDRTDDGGGWGHAGILYPALRLTPCIGARWGEVVSIFPGVLTAAASVTTTDSNGTTVTGNPNQSRCGKDVLTYLGVDADSRFGWSMLIGATAAIGPTTRQRISGQSWIACVITAVNGKTATSTPYTRSVKDTLTIRVLPPSFGSCSQLVVAAEFIAVPCDKGHRVEIFGVKTESPGEPRDTQAHLNASCLQLIGWLMRDRDPTKKGLLSVRAAASHQDTATGTFVEGLGVPGDSSKAVCFVEPVGPRQLLGTLFGLGSNPVPWR